MRGEEKRGGIEEKIRERKIDQRRRGKEEYSIRYNMYNSLRYNI